MGLKIKDIQDLRLLIQSGKPYKLPSTFPKKWLCFFEHGQSYKPLQIIDILISHLIHERKIKNRLKSSIRSQFQQLVLSPWIVAFTIFAVSIFYPLNEFTIVFSSLAILISLGTLYWAKVIEKKALLKVLLELLELDWIYRIKAGIGAGFSVRQSLLISKIEHSNDFIDSVHKDLERVAQSGVGAISYLDQRLQDKELSISEELVFQEGRVQRIILLPLLIGTMVPLVFIFIPIILDQISEVV